MKLSFKDGEENRQIIETREQRDNSIFKDQYAHADRIFEELFNDTVIRRYNNILSFCGERGSGKTSCMKSFIAQKIEVENSSCFSLSPIDPSFFDESHNIVELVIGRMYAEVQNEGYGYNDDVRDELLVQFNKVMIYLKYLAKPDQKENYYDGLQELEALSVGLSLQKSINELFEKFLKYVRKKILVISIDDLDLNIEGAYIMAEHIRKYLTNENSIILLSVKIEQLIEAIEINIQETQKIDNIDSHEMATKYVTKLIPISNRVNMPGLEDYCNHELSYVHKDETGTEISIEYHSVKEAVTHSIFWTTGYLFYNSKGRSSLMVPTTLRSLRQLLHLLHCMPVHDKNKPEEHKQNQRQFKRYFFNTWTQQLYDPYRGIALKIANLASDITLNKAVLANLSSLDILKANERFKALLDSSNYSYNVSLGDVMNVLEYLSQNENDVQLQMLVFFIRSIYSIRLYESYDSITENVSKNLYPNATNEASVGEIYSSDAMFKHTNGLQRIVNGQYFNFAPNTVLPPQIVKDAEPQSRDKRLINGDELIQCLEFLSANRNVEDESYIQKFRMVEFFMLTVSHLADIKKRTDNWEVKTNSATPLYMMPFNSGVKNMVFDILAPFYNLLNIKDTYSRFDSNFQQNENDQTLYDFASEKEWSLLNSIKGNNGRPYYDDMQHASLSDIVIRNAEVLNALMELIRTNRYNRYSANNVKCIKEFYDSIRQSGMKTYPRSRDEKPYQIEFSFLTAFHNLLEVCDAEEFDRIYGRQTTLESIVSDLFTASSYAQSTILWTLSKALKEVYQKRSRSEWKQLFPNEERHSRERIIEIVEQIQKS